MLNYSPTGVAFAGGFLGGALVAASIISLAYYIILIIAGWRVFEKAGEAGWKVLIPIYNLYIFYKIVGMQKWFWITLIVSFVVSLIISSLGQGTQLTTVNMATSAGVLSFMLLFALSVFALGISIMYAIRTSKAFGRGGLFAVGLFFLSGIFLLILGFGKSKYNKKLVASWK